jgi:hypothetical protein
LCKNLEIALAETNTTLAEVRSFSAGILLPKRIVCFLRRGRRIREFGFELGETILAGTYVAQKVEVVV